MAPKDVSNKAPQTARNRPGDRIASSANADLEADSVSTGVFGRILVVDDERNIRSSLQMVLAAEGFTVDLAADGDEAEKIMAVTPPEVVLLDVRLPGRHGIELLGQWRETHQAMPIVLMSGEATLEEAFEGLKSGAYDFLEKPLVQARVLNAVKRAIERRRFAEGVEDEERIIGNSPALTRLLADVEKIAPLKTRVLITGESGTGKDLVARAIHRLSARSAKPFIKVNCAAIPSELIESELFGHVKGAFTGAISARRGLFESASGGTLFLDEIGELSASAQAKILRALQNGEVTPVGSDLTIEVDVRVVAATNRDLKTEIELGHFREDLYYRLAVVCIDSPALRQRPTDVEPLVLHFAKQISRDNGLASKAFDRAALEALTAYPWPGNIRELRNVVERLVILGGPQIAAADLPQEILSSHAQESRGSSAASASSSGARESLGGSSGEATFSPSTWEEFKSRSEREFLVQTLRHCRGNVSEAARVLKVERSTVHKWLKSHQIAKHHYIV